MKNPTDILPKLEQYESAIYTALFRCPVCGESGIFNHITELERPALIGWCDTPWGLMVVLECPKCFTKYRFHGAANSYDLEAFNHDVYDWFISKGNTNIAWVSNAKELYNKMLDNETEK